MVRNRRRNARRSMSGKNSITILKRGYSKPKTLQTHFTIKFDAQNIRSNTKTRIAEHTRQTVTKHTIWIYER